MACRGARVPAALLPSWANAIDAHRLHDVLKLLLTHFGDIERELAFDLLIGVVGKPDRAGTGQRLDSGGDIDPVAVDVALVDDNVTDVDAYAELNPTIFGNIGIAFGHGALDLHGAADGVNSACELDQRTVARRLDDTAAMFRNFGSMSSRRYPLSAASVPSSSPPISRL